MKMKSTFKFVIALAAWLAGPVYVNAGPGKGYTIRGRVVDPTGAGLVGAMVNAQPELGDTGGASTRADEQGGFLLVLEPGTYQVRAEAPGFLEATRRIVATAAGEISLELRLPVAPVEESITVVAPGGYRVPAISSSTRTFTLLRDVPQAVSVVAREQVRDQGMLSIGDAVRYVPGVAAVQGENNRDQIVIRGQNSSADFFVNGVRDDVQYYRDLYNLDRLEVLKGPNALAFGRGGAGGVVNRVTKEAGQAPVRELSAHAGAYGTRRIAGDFGQPLGKGVAARVNVMSEAADSFRNGVDLGRWAVNPTLTFQPGRTRLSIGYERVHDARVADRGITSFQGRPADVDRATFYGDPAQSPVRADVHFGSLAVEHTAGRVTLRNRTVLADYDRSYQNFVPGAVTPDKRQVSLSAYNNATTRQNLFNQTDFILSAHTGGFKHTLLAGAEVGGQRTDNFRNTGYFDGAVTTLLVPYATPTISVPVTFRQSATDADNHVEADVAAVYLQDQVEIRPSLQAVAGLRLDRFALQYHNNRNGEELGRTDDLLSPRAGIVWKPLLPVSLYVSYGVSHLPSSGDQVSSLTVITQQLQPETLRNYELGAKWDARSDLSLTAALYRLDRTNTRSTDPNDPTRIVQTGSQRTDGFEVGANGRLTPAWSVAGGYAWQDAVVTSATAAARLGARVAQVPKHTLSLWNHYRFAPRFAAALGVLFRTDMFAGIDNSVTLPGYTRLDAAVYFNPTRALRLQANVENLTNTGYWLNAHDNTNLSPGAPRSLRIGLNASF
jgi:catecholate siderophore receptor